jgi:metal-responsive CopG/Arc/MetJ family transcriptional regulator
MHTVSSPRGDAVRATITIPEERLAELMELTGAETRTAAINTAIETFVRQAKLRRLLELEGAIDVLSNDEIEALDDESAAPRPGGERG